jgi:hypothetical protein
LPRSRYSPFKLEVTDTILFCKSFWLLSQKTYISAWYSGEEAGQSQSSRLVPIPKARKMPSWRIWFSKSYLMISVILLQTEPAIELSFMILILSLPVLKK